MDIRECVNNLIRTYKSRNPFEVIKEMDVILVFCPLKDVKGFYQHFHRNSIIYIDESLTDNEKLFVCAHELGHIILHKSSNAFFMDTKTQFNTTKYENEANKFAIDYLIDDNTLLAFSEYNCEQISNILGYSQKLIALRIEELKATQ